MKRGLKIANNFLLADVFHQLTFPRTSETNDALTLWSIPD
jgi:hypothetical protein